MGDRPDIATAAVIGCGVIGAGWAARLRMRGVAVRAYDPAAVAEQVLGEVHENAMRAWRSLDVAPEPGAVGSLTMCASIADACEGAGFVVESVPERLDLKHATLAAIDQAAEPSALIAAPSDVPFASTPFGPTLIRVVVPSWRSRRKTS